MSSMDDDENFTESRDELLNRFRQSLSKPMSDRFFDEDDLVEIFDYAGDIADDYLRMEALMCGARFFPDSEPLLERRGIFFSQYSDSARQQFLTYGQKTDSLIFDLLSIRDNMANATTEEVTARIDEMIDQHSSLTDEEVIQLSEAVQDLGLYEWYKAKLPALRQKAEYLTGLLYETGMVAEINRDYAFSARMLEELTEIEPFNSYYWMLLSRQYAQMEDADKALSAIDYSLAINPADPLSLYLKAGYYNSLGKETKEIEDLATKAFDSSSGSVEVTQFLAEFYYKSGRTQKAIALINRVLDNPEMGVQPPLFNNTEPAPVKELELIPLLIKYGADNIDLLLDRYYAANPDNQEILWCAWATQLSQQGHTDIAHKVMECYERNSGNRSASIFAIEQHFMEKDFDQAMSEIVRYVRDMKDVEYDSNYPAILAMHIISMVKVGAYDTALRACNAFIDTFMIEPGLSVSQRVEKVGLLSLIIHMRDMLDKPESHGDWHDFDPLHIWQ